MAQVLLAVEKYDQHLLESAPRHPLCGRPTVCATLLRDGTGINVVPELCTLSIDRRVVPGEDPDQAQDGLIQWIDQHTDVDVEHERPFSVARIDRTSAHGR